MAGVGALAAGVLAVALTAGCATTISGTAVPGSGGAPAKTSGPSTKPQEPTAADSLGDLTTIDPCSLTDPGVFDGFGTAKLGVPDSLHDCLVEIKTSAKSPVTLYVGGLDRTERYPDAAGKKSKDLPGGLRVVDYESEATRCEQLLIFPDDITMSVYAALDDGEEPRLCDMVTAGMDKAVEVVRDRGVTHYVFPSGSLGSIDPCAVVPPEATEPAPGLGSAKPESWPARHSCFWASADGNTRIRVNFLIGRPIEANGRGSREVSIAGRTTVVYQTPVSGDGVFCSAETSHIPFAVKGQSGLVEAANLFVRLPEGQMDAACKAAEEVATAVWPKLPKP
jgi:hypothetical protein